MKTESSEDNCESVEDMDNCWQCYGIGMCARAAGENPGIRRWRWLNDFSILKAAAVHLGGGETTGGTRVIAEHFLLFIPFLSVIKFISFQYWSCF